MGKFRADPNCHVGHNYSYRHISIDIETDATWTRTRTRTWTQQGHGHNKDTDIDTDMDTETDMDLEFFCKISIWRYSLNSAVWYVHMTHQRISSNAAFKFVITFPDKNFDLQVFKS